MPERPVEVEQAGIEHIPDDKRHGAPGRVFTLWFAANLTVADYVIGVLTVRVFGLTVIQALPVLAIGNLLGGVVLGLSAAMGPKLGFPQMLSSRSSFGRRGNYLFGGLNWISTVGWFTVNTILGVEAAQTVFPGLNFYVAATALVALQIVVAVYGHDFIQLFEKAMSVVLALLFFGIFVLTIPRLNEAFSFVPTGGSAGAASLGTLGVVLAVSFSYLMSWSPYASDYTRYLPSSTSGRRVALYALAGGAGASFAVEAIGALVGSLTSGLGFGGLYGLAGQFGPVAILAIILGAMAANALNIYTNSLSALVLDVKTKRWVAVLVGGLVGLALSFAGQVNFELNFENFLLVLDYWIMPWLGIVLVDYYVSRRTSVKSSAEATSFDFKATAAYLAAVLVSVPFMVPALPFGYPVGALSSLFGGADFSYFISFLVAAGLTYLLRRRG
ncbi:MAG TPA: cytosine permease [Nitrososphaerales archaeon]|nr:cytosine permease [Nitrososphaerales archaeon]